MGFVQATFEIQNHVKMFPGTFSSICFLFLNAAIVVCYKLFIFTNNKKKIWNNKAAENSSPNVALISVC